MVNPEEQFDLGQQIAAKLAEHAEALAHAQRTGEELRALMASAGIIVPSADITLELDSVKQATGRRPFPGFFSGREATAMTAVANYESTNTLDDAVAEILSPYSTKIQHEFDERWAALIEKPTVPRITHTLPWTEQNHPMVYGYAFMYKIMRRTPQLQSVKVEQSLIESNVASLTTKVDIAGDAITHVAVGWQTAQLNPQLPESFYENLGSREPQFDKYYRQLTVGTAHGLTRVWTNNSLYFRFGNTAKDYEMGFVRLDGNREYVCRYRYNENLASGPAFVRTDYNTQQGETPKPERLSIEEYLVWLDFALSTIPPSDLPIGSRPA